MGFLDLQELLTALDKDGDLARVSAPVDPDLEVSAIVALRRVANANSRRDITCPFLDGLPADGRTRPAEHPAGFESVRGLLAW